ncbi:DNA topoisomerase VI subunit B, partial [Candidatus Woesearchaeota archaeon]|nr:DNA topoisomerase VI subunit B [Candidatus Woesearchaeota archaeon]
IGAEQLEKGLKKEINAEFYCSVTRPPSVYRGNPFQIEAAIAYGGELSADDTVKLLRFANRVPLLYQQSSCAITESVIDTNWRSYGLQQSRKSLPAGPAVIVLHMASVWAPFTSEAKEAIAHYPEIIKEIKLALQECGRKLAKYVSKKRRVGDELKKRSYIEKYIPHVSAALKDLLELKKIDEEKINKALNILLEHKRGKIEKVGLKASENIDYDEEFAKIAKEE